MKWPGIATMIGLFLSLAGPVVFTVRWSRNQSGESTGRSTKDQIILWAILALLIALIVFGEGRPLDSIGLHAPTWATLGWAIAGASFIEVTGVFVFPLLTRIGFVDYSKKMAVVEKWPLWLILFAVLTAGVVEEALYRGYAIERLNWITNSYWWAAGISVAIFGLVHVPFWGRGALVWSIFAGSVFALLYLWKHDLLACMIAHIICNLKAMVIDLFLSRNFRQHAQKRSV